MAKEGKRRKERNRATRLSDALRENLRRRKQQARDRDLESDESGENSPDCIREALDKT